MTAHLPTVIDGSTVTFDVLGLPAPQGSNRHVGHGVLVESSASTPAPWRDSVTLAARHVAAHSDVAAPLDGPFRLDVTFRFPMPASRKAAVRRAGEAPKSTAPDLDKLVRAVGDALQAGGLIADDARLSSTRRRA